MHNCSLQSLKGSAVSKKREKLRSHNSAHPAFALFINKTDKVVAVEWLDFKGNHVSYNDRLHPNKSMMMNTYDGHPWVFYESDLRHPMAILPDRQQVYMPQKYEDGPIVYHEVHIVSPFSSLQQLCLNHLHKHVVKGCESRRDRKFADVLRCLENDWMLLKKHCDRLEKMEMDRLNRNIPFEVPHSIS